MSPNLRSLVAKAYRVRQGRTFSSSSSSAPNPIGKKEVIDLVVFFVSRGTFALTGFGVGSYLFRNTASEFNETRKENDKEAVVFLEKIGKLPPGSVDAMYKS